MLFFCSLYTRITREFSYKHAHRYFQVKTPYAFVFYRFSSVLGPPETPKRGAPVSFCSLWGSLGTSRGLLGPSWRPLRANKPPIVPPEPPRGAQNAPRMPQRPLKALPTGFPKASRRPPEGLPKAFRAAKWPRRDARSVYNIVIATTIAIMIE